MESAVTDVVDLGALERRLALRAEFHDHPGSYLHGVHDVLTALRQQGADSTADDRPGARTTRAG